MLPAMVYWSEVKYTSEIVQVTVYRFLPARKRGTCYGNVAGWLGGWLAGCHTPVWYQNG